MAATHSIYHNHILYNHPFRTTTLSFFIIAVLLGGASCSEVRTTGEEDQPIPVISRSTVDKLAQQVADLKSVVSIRDYEQAKVSLNRLKETWEQTKDDIKAQDPSKHEAIEIHIKAVETGLNADTPNNTAISSDLKLLEVVVYQLFQQPE